MTSPVPVTAKTPIYALEYLDEGEPAFWMRARLQRNSQKLEQLLQARGIAPPDAADLAALAGRVSTLEGYASPRLTLYRVSGGSFGGTFGVPYDGVNAGQTTPALVSNSNAYYLNDPTGRRVQIKQAGLYHFEVAMTTNVGNEAAQFVRLVKMPTANTAGPTIGIQNLTTGYGRLVAEERMAAGEYVGVFLNTSGSDSAESPATGIRNYFSIRRVSA
jgi:hypothetical protein